MTSTDIAVTQQNSKMGSFDERDQNLINYLGLNPNSPGDRAVVAVCRHYGFDPLLKHVIVIPKSGVYITRDGLLNVAHRSGLLDGIVVEQDPVLDADRQEWVAKVSVYRKDMAHPFTYPGRYPATGGNKQYAPEMALKSAEAHALRRAFDVTGLPTVDERRPNTPAAQPQVVTAADIVGEVPERKPWGAVRDQLNRRLFALLGKAGLTAKDQRENRLIVLSALAMHDAPIASSSDLSDDELVEVIATLTDLEANGKGGNGGLEAVVYDILQRASAAEPDNREQQ